MAAETKTPIEMFRIDMKIAAVAWSKSQRAVEAYDNKHIAHSGTLAPAAIARGQAQLQEARKRAHHELCLVAVRAVEGPTPTFDNYALLSDEITSPESILRYNGVCVGVLAMPSTSPERPPNTRISFRRGPIECEHWAGWTISHNAHWLMEEITRVGCPSLEVNRQRLVGAGSIKAVPVVFSTIKRSA